MTLMYDFLEEIGPALIVLAMALLVASPFVHT
jgi:hypothetical protein